jgi:hypothetical protein
MESSLSEFIVFLLFVLALLVGAVVLGMRTGRRAKTSSLARRSDSTGSSTSSDERRREPGALRPSIVFISYRREDSADVTGRIYDRFVQRLGPASVFKDVDSIPLGVDFRQHLDGVIQQCDVLIAVIGRAWFGLSESESPQGSVRRRVDDLGDYVRVEIASALRSGIPVIPVLVGGATLPNASQLPPDLSELAYRNGLPVRADPDFHKDVDRLIVGLETYIQKSS